MKASELFLKTLLKSVAVLSSKLPSQSNTNADVTNAITTNTSRALSQHMNLMLSWLWKVIQNSGPDIFLGSAGCNSTHKPLWSSPILEAHLEQVAQLQLHYASAILLYPPATITNTLPVYLYIKYFISNLLLSWFRPNLCPGQDPNPTLQKCSCSCRTASISKVFPSIAGQVKDNLCRSSLATRSLKQGHSWS